jgi:NAD(P)-dependent dehydrogenase (short-subunit alcohol dehydrogenase family)
MVPPTEGGRLAKEKRSLSGKVVAITGGARGIGKATATALARRGARIAIGDLDLERS